MWAGIIALLIAEFIGGALGPLFVKIGVGEFPPITFTAFRFIIASVIFIPFYLSHRTRNLKKRDHIALISKSIFFFLNATLFGLGIQYTTVIMSQVLYVLLPLIVFVLAYFILKEKFTSQKIIGLILGIIGVIFLIGESIAKTEALSFGSPLGNILILGAVFSWAIYFVFSKELQKRYTPATIIFYNFLTAVAFLLCIIPFELTIRPLVFSKITIVGVTGLLGVSIFTSVIMISLIQFGIKRTTAFTASLFQYMGPFFAALTGIPFLGEKPTVGFIIGGFLIIVGVFYATSYHLVKKQLRSVIQ